MCQTILFSPIGGHDPISNFHDGAMLHIARAYKPQKVVLYLSNEMLARQQQDERYTKSVQKLSEYLQRPIDVMCVEREQLRDVHLFDTFYHDFEAVLSDLHTQYPQATILLNLSSGTPAMKSALYVIDSLATYTTLAIQVSTPNKSENIHKDVPFTYDSDDFFELNEDNAPDYVNRCIVAQSENFTAKITTESIKKLILAYNYEAALVLAKQIEPWLPATFYKQLSAAAYRLQLNQSAYTKAMQGSADFMPIRATDKRIVFEYVLMLMVKEKQGNYSDFIRGLTPVLLTIFEKCLMQHCNIDLKDYCVKYQKKQGDIVYRLSYEKLQKTEKGLQMLQAWDEKYNEPVRDGTIYTTAHIAVLLDALSNDREMVECMQQIRDVEVKVRNFVAHQTVSVTDEWIEKRCDLTTKQIIKCLKTSLMKSGINITPDYWNSYENMNNALLAQL